MKYILQFSIHLYWLTIPKRYRKKCIFNTSCSHYVYNALKHNGLKSGISALKFRYQNCRYGFQLFKNPITGQTNMILPNQEIIEENQIAKRLL